MGSVKCEPTDSGDEDEMDTAEEMDDVNDKSYTPGREKRKYSGGAAADNGGGGGSRGGGVAQDLPCLLDTKGLSAKRPRYKPENFKPGEGGGAKNAEDKCQVCKLVDGEAEMILCDDCNQGFHIYCLNPKLPKVPEGDWYCQSCCSLQPEKFSAQISDVLGHEDFCFEATDKQVLLTELLDKLQEHATCPAATKLYSERKDEIGKQVAGFYDEKKGWFKECPDATHRKDYLQYVKYCRTLKSLSEVFALKGHASKHLTLDVKYQKLLDCTKIQIKELEAKATKEIKDEDDLVCTLLGEFLDIWPEWQKVYPQADVEDFQKNIEETSKKLLENIVDQVKEKLETPDTKMVQTDHAFIAQKLVKGCAIASIIQAVKSDQDWMTSYKKRIQSTLATKPGGARKAADDRACYIIGESLTPMALESPYAQAILHSFPAFKNFSISLFNKKASVKFEEAQSQMTCEPVQVPKEKFENLLKVVHDKYKETYDAEIREIICKASLSSDEERLKSNIVQDESYKKRILEETTGLRDHTFTSQGGLQLSKEPRKFGKLLGLVCAAWTYLDCKDWTAMAGGEGQDPKNTRQPHSMQIISICRLLSADVPDGRLSDHLIQIKTGEGKSIAMGLTAVMLALLGFSVDVVCYSRYLCDRDRQNFDSLFQLLDQGAHISYNDFSRLSSIIMDRGVPGWPNVRTSFKSFLEGKSVPVKIKTEGRKSVLLVDEVDVFFGEDFYGKPYRPSIDLEHEAGFKLIQFVWDSRDKIFSVDILMKQLEVYQAVTSLRSEFPNFSDEILQRELDKMLEAARRFPKSRYPGNILRGREKEYTIISINSQKSICYINPASGVPDESITYSYVTAFTYLHELKLGHLSGEAVRKHVKLQMVCGTLSYSKIPELYDHRLGMTGTLDCLTPQQVALMEKHGFKHRTYMASTFVKQILNAKQSQQDTETVVVQADKNEYFGAIFKDVEREIKKGRAILIIFANEDRIKWFRQNIENANTSSLTGYKSPLELIDKQSEKQRASIIVEAIFKYRITLVTRSFGRGTDFVCRDTGLVKNGGVHIILTFLPEDKSEEEQIFGRTCRQDDPGSARKILLAGDLEDDPRVNLLSEYLDQQKTQKNWVDEAGAPKQNKWDEFLEQRRDKHLGKKHASMEMCCTDSEEKHRKTLLACHSKDEEEAAKLFDAASQALVERTSMESFHIVFVLDESGSMNGSNWQQLRIAVSGFLDVRRKTHSKDVVSFVLFNDSARTLSEEPFLLVELTESLLESLLCGRWGNTLFGPALRTACDVIGKGAKHAKSPLLIFMTAGCSGDSGEQEMTKLCEESQNRNDGLLVKTIGFGQGADAKKLKKLATHVGDKRGEYLHAVEGDSGEKLNLYFENAAESLSHNF